MRKLTLWNALALAAALVVGGCASPSGTSDASLLQRMDTVMRQAAPSRSVSLRLSASQVKSGEPIAAEVISNMSGYAYVFQIGTEGQKLSVVFPNAMDGANFVDAGVPLALPRPHWRMSTRGPAGVGHMLAVVTEKPLDLMVLQSNTAVGKLDVPGEFGAAMATLREVAP